MNVEVDIVSGDVPYEAHVFVCTSGTWCPTDGAAVAVFGELKRLVNGSPALRARVRVNQSGCLGQCGHGPLMVVYPENVWYCKMTPEKVREVFERHLGEGIPVEAWRYHPAPGDHKLVRDAAGRVVEDPCHADLQSLSREGAASHPSFEKNTVA